MRYEFACLVLLLAGCAASPAPSTPRAGAPITIDAWSTIGWGCPVPPFRRHTCGGTEEAPNEDPVKCYFLTRTTNTGEPWDFARVNGAYRLVGRWTQASLTHTDWLRRQNEPLPEGADTSTKYALFEVDRYCIHAADVQRHLQLLADRSDDPPSDGEQTRRWLRQHECR